ncbi:MAG: hypothetical protein Q8N28_01840 [bacterium]|nr:hypothetical protein [bacterium]
MIDYNKLTNDFKQLAEDDKLSHAYLFYGENQEEKIIFAQSLVNFSETLIIEPDEKGTIGIDIIRSLKYFLWQKPISSNLRIVIIKEAENLTNQAQNAALKIVEEPPESALIIFIVKNIENLLPTLTSRLQKIHFPQTLRAAPSLRAKRSNPKDKKIASGYHPRNDHSSGLPPVDIDQFFKNLIGDLKKDPIKNSQRLKEILKRLVLIKQFNVNKRLQLKAIQ